MASRIVATYNGTELDISDAEAVQLLEAFESGESGVLELFSGRRRLRVAYGPGIPFVLEVPFDD